MGIKILLSIVLCVCASGDFVYEDAGSESNTRELSLYSASALMYHFNVRNVTLVDIHYSLDIFNYCDLNSYTPAGVSRLLEAHHIAPKDIRNGARWIALITKHAQGYIPECSSKYSISYSDMYTLFNALLVSHYIERTGKMINIYISSFTMFMMYQHTKMFHIYIYVCASLPMDLF